MIISFILMTLTFVVEMILQGQIACFKPLSNLSGVDRRAKGLLNIKHEVDKAFFFLFARFYQISGV